MEVVANNISKTYYNKNRAVRVLNNLSFTAEAGKVLAILGPNGAGKSTMFNIFANLIAPDGGEFSVLGLTTKDERYHDNISFVSSETQFLWFLSAGQILKFYQKLFSVDDKRASLIHKELGLSEQLNRKWHQMSSGERMRVRLAKGLLTSPKVLFLDEPTVGLDPDIADKLRLYLKSLKDTGMCIILTSHLMLDVEKLADEICFLKKGEVIFKGVLGEEFFKPKINVVFEDNVQTEYDKISDNTLQIEPNDLKNVLQLGQVKEVFTVKNDLESLFIKLSRNK